MILLTKEEKTIEASNIVIKDICPNSSDQDLAKEFEVLAKGYEKLNKRYNRIIKLNDSMHNAVVRENEDLESEKHHIVKVSKAKIMGNISSQRAIKETHSDATFENQKKLKDCISVQNILGDKLQATTDKFKKTVEVIGVLKEKTVLLNDMKDDLTRQLRFLEETTISFDELLDREITHMKATKEPLALAMLSIDNYVAIRSKLSEDHSEDELLTTIYKTIVSEAPDNSIIYYDTDDDIFHILIPYLDLDAANSAIISLVKKRVILKSSITLSGGVTSLNILEDNTKVMTQRCLEIAQKAFENASKSTILTE